MKATRFIPQDSTGITRDSVPAIVYIYTSKQSRPAAIAYIGNQSKSTWHYQFMSEEQRTKKINDLFDNVAYSEGRKAERRAERTSFRHGYQVGDVLYSSWGYDQTNIEFYQVIDTTEKTVTFQEIAQDTKSEGFMSYECTPVLNKFIGKPYTRTVRPALSGEKGAVNFAEYEGGMIRRLWAHDGRPKHSTCYA